MTFPASFPATRYRLESRVESPLRLPEYAGSTLRGAFGRALRRSACLTREAACPPCPLWRSCPYPAIFQPPPPSEHALQKFSEIPPPFIVEPPDWGVRAYHPGERLVFHLVLIGRALEQLPLIVHAWQRALADGIGPGDGRAVLERIVLADDRHAPSVYSTGGGLLPHSQCLPDPPPGTPATTTSLRLSFQTPLRLQRNGRPLRPRDLDARDLLITLVRRIALLSEFHAGSRLDLDFSALARCAVGVASEKSLHWRDWTRYSSRQKQEMTLGGCVGDWTLRGDLTPFLPYLHLGQWLHVGKNAAFGLGRYTLTA